MDTRALGGLLGLLAGAAVTEEAEGAVRPDILDVVKKAVAGKKYSGVVSGTLESGSASKSFENSVRYAGSTGYFNNHGLVQRAEKDNWTPEQIAEGFRAIFDSPETVVVPNVLGKSPVAKEALWNPHGEGGRSWYMPILPYKKGFQTVTLYDPKTLKVENMLKEKGYWEGGSNSSIFTPSLDEGLVQPVGSGPVSAVSSPVLGNTLQEQLKKLKGKLPVLAGASTGLGLASAPSKAQGGPVEPGLESPWFDPVDILLAPVGVTGRGAKAAAMALEPAVSAGMSGLLGMFGKDD